MKCEGRCSFEWRPSFCWKRTLLGMPERIADESTLHRAGTAAVRPTQHGANRLAAVGSSGADGRRRAMDWPLMPPSTWAVPS